MQERRRKENDPILSQGSARDSNGSVTPRSQQQEKVKSYEAYFIDGMVSILLCISVHLASNGTEVKVSVEQKCAL